MATYWYHILGFVLGSYMVVICRSYEVFFGLKGRSEGSQALFNDETDVIITCNVTCLVNVSIQIDVVGNDRAHRPTVFLKENNLHGHFLDLTLASLTLGAKFRCLVKGNDSTTGNEVSKDVFWSPHIIMETDPVYCRRNGTVSQPYKIGDILLLECFCNLTLATSCQWISDINTTRTELTNESVEMKENLKVYRLVVGPITAADLSTRYECVSSYQGISRACAINIRKFSSADYVFNPISSSDCDTATDISTKGTPNQSTNGITSGEDPSFKRETIIFVGISSFIFIVIFISLVSALILIIQNIRKAKYKKDDNGDNYYATINDRNQVKVGLQDTIDQYGSSVPFKSDKANHFSLTGPNDNSNVHTSENDNCGYSLVNKKDLPHIYLGQWDKPQPQSDYDIVPKVDTEVEINFSSVYAEARK